ncbi:MAG: hypothetical protein H0V26_14475 [Solirubrobacterales bacterium]|nr:hypothetical protein [Solirubrobacterales bacterium]
MILGDSLLVMTGLAEKEGLKCLLWTVAVDNLGFAGRWAFLEVSDPWDAEHLSRTKFLSAARVQGRA